MDGSPYLIAAAGPFTGIEESNYDITFVDGALTVVVASEPPPPPDPNPDPGGGLPNPIDVITGADDATAAIGDTGDTQIAESVLEIVGSVSDQLEADAVNCREEEGATTYLNCLVEALDQYAEALDSIRDGLPPELQSVADTIVDLRNQIDAARATAEIRLQGATTAAERAAIEAEAINTARAAVQSAAAEIQLAIGLIRADDPELAAVQIETGNLIVEALQTVDTELARAVEL